MEYELIRSDRKTIAIQIRPDGRVVVRAPRRMNKARIEAFVREKEGWIQAHMPKAETLPGLTDGELKQLTALAKADLPLRVAGFARRLGVSYGSVTIRHQRTRWGSCTGAGNLNFNCLLMLAPEPVRDYVVVHELCHRLEMNHSARFWAHVAGAMPDYCLHRKWLKANGPSLVGRLHK